jgi:hypothetical protein
MKTVLSQKVIVFKVQSSKIKEKEMATKTRPRKKIKAPSDKTESMNENASLTTEPNSRFLLDFVRLDF